MSKNKKTPKKNDIFGRIIPKTPSENILNIESFLNKSFISNSINGILRSNRFRVEINPPEMLLKQNSSNIVEKLTYNVLSISCPQISMDLGNAEINTWFKYYYKGRTDSDLSISFLESSDLEIRRFFESWIRLGFDPITKIRKYIDDISKGTSIILYPLGNNTNPEYAEIFEEIFPYEINNLEFNYSEDNSILKTEVKFKFIFHYIEKVR